MAVPDNVVPFPKAPTPTSDPAPLTEETNFLQKAGFKYSGLNDWLINYIDGTKDILGKYQIDLHEKQKSEQPSPREDNHMDWQEKYIDKLDRDMGEMKASLRVTEERIGSQITQTMEEMRSRDLQRHQENLAINNSILAVNKATDDKIAGIRNSIDAQTKWVIGLIIGVLGLIVAVLGLMYRVYSSSPPQ